MAKIYYAKLDKLWSNSKYKLYHKIETASDIRGTPKKYIVIKKKQFRKLWRPVDTSRTKGKTTPQKLEGLWEKYNIGQTNIKTPKGQEMIRRKGVGHSSMSVGDMVKLGDKHYVASNVGWTPVRFRG